MTMTDKPSDPIRALLNAQRGHQPEPIDDRALGEDMDGLIRAGRQHRQDRMSRLAAGLGADPSTAAPTPRDPSPTYTNDPVRALLNAEGNRLHGAHNDA